LETWSIGIGTVQNRNGFDALTADSAKNLLRTFMKKLKKEPKLKGRFTVSLKASPYRFVSEKG